MEFERLLDDLKRALQLLPEHTGSEDLTQDYPYVQLHANVAAAYALTQIRGGLSVQTFLSHLGDGEAESTAAWWKARFLRHDGEDPLAPLPSVVRQQLALFLRDFQPDINIDWRSLWGGAAPALRLDEKLSEILLRELNSKSLNAIQEAEPPPI
jgi:hypothetical protein